jgi:hypothetical protein
MTDSTSKICLYCNKEYKTKSGNSKFCSYEHYRSYAKQFTAQRKKQNKIKTKTSDGSPCIGCIIENECKKKCVAFKMFKGTYY